MWSGKATLHGEDKWFPPCIWSQFRWGGGIDQQASLGRPQTGSVSPFLSFTSQLFPLLPEDVLLEPTPAFTTSCSTQVVILLWALSHGEQNTLPWAH
jgi:hypothetical protein